MGWIHFWSSIPFLCTFNYTFKKYLDILILIDEYWVNWRNNVMTMNMNENMNFNLENILPHCLPWPSIKNNFESSRAKSEFHMRKMSIFQGHKKNEVSQKRVYLWCIQSNLYVSDLREGKIQSRVLLMYLIVLYF